MRDHFTALVGDRRGSDRPDPPPLPALPWWEGLRGQSIEAERIANWLRDRHREGCAILRISRGKSVRLAAWTHLSVFSADGAFSGYVLLVEEREYRAVMALWPHDDLAGDYDTASGLLTDA
jgi:hypothetical protein